MRTKKAFLNTGTALVYQIIALISGLIVPRLVLQYYGSEVNGVMSSVLQFMNAIGILNIGITGAARVVLYKSLANDEKKTTNNLMTAVIIYMHKVAFILILYIIFLAIIFPYISNTSVSKKIIILLVLVIGLNKFFELFLGQPYRILLQADQKHYVENIFTSIFCIIYTFVSVIMIENNACIISVKFVSSVISLGIFLGIYTYVKKNYRIYKIKNYDKNILSQKKAAAIHSVANLIHQNSDLIILTVFESMKIVSIYTVYYYIIGQIKALFSSFTSSLEAGLGNVWAKKEYKILNRTFRIYEWFTYVFVIVVFSCVISLILPFISLYTKGVNDINYILPVLAILIVIAESVYCIRTPFISLIYAAGKYEETQNIAVLEAIFNMGISLICVWRLGINGVIIGTIFANIIRTSYSIFYCSKRLLDRNLKVVIKDVSWTIIMMICIITCQNAILKILGNIDSWSKWVIGGILSFAISLLFTIASSFLFYKKEMYYSYELIKPLLMRK